MDKKNPFGFIKFQKSFQFVDHRQSKLKTSVFPIFTASQCFVKEINQQYLQVTIRKGGFSISIISCWHESKDMEFELALEHTLNLLNNNSCFGQNLPQLPDWPLVQGLEPWGCFPDGVFSLCLICVAAKVDFWRITASAATTGVVRGQKSRLLLLPWLSIICKLAWGAISQTNACKQRKKKILPSRHPSVTCEKMHLWYARADAWWWCDWTVNNNRLRLT